MKDYQPYLLNFAHMIDAADWILAKGGDGAISVKLLRGWIWDNNSDLTEKENRVRFDTLKDMTQKYIQDFPEKFEIVQDVSFDDDEKTIYAKMKVLGIGMNRDQLHEYARRTF